MTRRITGEYVNLEIDGVRYEVFYESAGTGIPLVCLHTAGADARQFHPLMRHAALEGFRVVAFDMPYHGRSLPPDSWWTSEYRLTGETYRAMVLAFVEALSLSGPVLMGCSMGAKMAVDAGLALGAEARAVIALGAGAARTARLNPFLHHPACNEAEVVATYTLGLNAPQSPERQARTNWWIYAQSGPGVYAGDLEFYSAWQPPGPATPDAPALYFLTGEYDYSCLPEAANELASSLRAEHVETMAEIGHFPMIENPHRLIEHLSPILSVIRRAAAGG